ncbi:MAG: hypothetical protein Q9184_004839, partial [Pyrenodesmia sp. 2 TL-2023]
MATRPKTRTERLKERPVDDKKKIEVETLTRILHSETILYKDPARYDQFAVRVYGEREHNAHISYFPILAKAETVHNTRKNIYKGLAGFKKFENGLKIPQQLGDEIKKLKEDIRPKVVI